MDSNYEGRKKVMSILGRVVQAAKDLGLDKLASLAMTVIKGKAKMEGAATAMKEHIADALASNKDLKEYIDSDPKLAESVKKLNYDPSTVYALYNDLQKKIEASFLKTKEQEARVGEIEMERGSLDNKRDEEIAAAKERLDAAKAELEEAKAAVAEAEKNAKDSSKAVAKTNITKLYEKAKAAAKEHLANDLMRDENPASDKPSKPEAKPEGKPEKKKEPGINDILDRFKPKKKEDAKTSLNGVTVKAADSEAAFSEAFAEVQEAEGEMSEHLSAFAVSLEGVDSMLDGAIGGLEEAAAMMEAAPEEAPADEEAPAEEEGPGMMDKLKDMFMPSPAPMQMAPAMTSVQSPWLKESTIEATADVKHFPSEFDQSSGHLEVVEGDNGQKLVVKKDLKSKVQQKIKEAATGKYNAGESVAVDLGDRIVAAVIKQYASEGVYEVVSEGRILRVPDANVFKDASQIWRE